jgi:urea transport system ATP-binding protein
MLRIEGLNQFYGGSHVLRDISLEVPMGQVTALLGRNGVGKTTLLDLICGKTRSTEGRIRFMGDEVTRLAEHEIVRKGIGRKFQTPSIYENLSVWSNLEVSFPRGRGVFGALGFKCTPDVKERVEAVAQEINLSQQLYTEAGLL